MSTPPIGQKLRAADFPNGITSMTDLQRLGALINPALEKLKSTIANGVNLAQNIDGQIVSFQVTTPSTDWTNFTPTTWTNPGGAYPSFGWRANSVGETWLRGRIATLPALATTLATLPAAAAPASTIRFPADAAGAYGAVEVAASGAISQVVGSILGTLDFGMGFASVNNAPGIPSAFPQQVRIKDGRKPQAVLLLSAQDSVQGNPPNTPNTGGATPSILASGVQWSYVQSGTGQNFISIDGIPGLALGRTYNLSALLLF